MSKQEWLLEKRIDTLDRQMKLQIESNNLQNKINQLHSKIMHSFERQLLLQFALLIICTLGFVIIFLMR